MTEHHCAEDEKPYRPSPDFQEPCDLVPADLVPPRDAPAALMDNDGIAVLAAPGKPAEGTQTDGPAQVSSCGAGLLTPLFLLQ